MIMIVTKQSLLVGRIENMEFIKELGLFIGLAFIIFFIGSIPTALSDNENWFVSYTVLVIAIALGLTIYFVECGIY